MAYTNIDDPSAYFQTATYTGAGANQTVTNDGNSDLQPDWLWIKRRNAGYAHALFDSNRGLGSSNPPMLESNSTAVENSNQNWISGVSTDGFTIGINEQNLSNTSGTYVAWQWKANGGTTSSNSDGSITSTVQANTDAGFSIVTYTGTGANATVGHGLGVTPNIVFYKNRTDSGITGSTNANWIVQSSALNVDEYIKLNETAAAATDTGYFRSTRPSSTVLTLGTYNSNNGSSDNLIAYCFAEKQGYSKFGKYVGNGSQDGPMVWTGFKPAFVIMKRTDNTGAWHLFDNKRSGYNYANDVLQPQASAAELSGQTYQFVDLLSNGFKVRRATHGPNVSGETYIFMAFAENPFTTSTGIPTTAR